MKTPVHSFSHSQRAIGQVSEWFKGPPLSPSARTALRGAAKLSEPLPRALSRRASATPAWVAPKNVSAISRGSR